MNDGLRDLGADSADGAVGSHQGGRHGPDQVLCHQRVDRRDAGDGNLGSRGDNLLKQVP
jgi:hypothetical protein